jgi:hypothetical protein
MRAEAPVGRVNVNVAGVIAEKRGPASKRGARAANIGLNESKMAKKTLCNRVRMVHYSAMMQLAEKRPRASSRPHEQTQAEHLIASVGFLLYILRMSALTGLGMASADARHAQGQRETQSKHDPDCVHRCFPFRSGVGTTAHWPRDNWVDPLPRAWSMLKMKEIGIVAGRKGPVS